MAIFLLAKTTNSKLVLPKLVACLVIKLKCNVPILNATILNDHKEYTLFLKLLAYTFVVLLYLIPFNTTKTVKYSCTYYLVLNRSNTVQYLQTFVQFPVDHWATLSKNWLLFIRTVWSHWHVCLGLCVSWLIRPSVWSY